MIRKSIQSRGGKVFGSVLEIVAIQGALYRNGSGILLHRELRRCVSNCYLKVTFPDPLCNKAQGALYAIIHGIFQKIKVRYFGISAAARLGWPIHTGSSMPRSGPNLTPNLRCEAVTPRQCLGVSFAQNRRETALRIRIPKRLKGYHLVAP